MAAADRDLRASDAEREHAVDQLRRHAAEGRLDFDEFEQRVAEALAARTRGDLEPVLRELPPLAPAPTPTARRSLADRLADLPVPTGRTVASIVAVAVAVVLVTQGVWWIVFPLMGFFGGCGRGRRGWGACSTGGGRRHEWRDDRRSGRPDADDRDLIRV
jgi:hypothetical protein